jgi:hypothetical protein
MPVMKEGHAHEIRQVDAFICLNTEPEGIISVKWIAPGFEDQPGGHFRPVL